MSPGSASKASVICTKCSFSNRCILLSRCRHTGKHACTGVMPVINNVNGMTNQSGRDGNLLADRRMSAGRFTGMSPAPGTGPGSTIPAPAFCTLPAHRHHNTYHATPPRDSSVRCCIHCSTSLLYPRLLRPGFMGSGKWPSLISL